MTHKIKVWRTLPTMDVRLPVGRPHFGQTKASVEIGFPQLGQSTNATAIPKS
jgi:hypothetical protein